MNLKMPFNSSLKQNNREWMHRVLHGKHLLQIHFPVLKLFIYYGLYLGLSVLITSKALWWKLISVLLFVNTAVTARLYVYLEQTTWSLVDTVNSLSLSMTDNGYSRALMYHFISCGYNYCVLWARAIAQYWNQMKFNH
jgi:hypothetical protein